MSLAHTNVRERTILPSTPPVVRKMNTEGSTFRDGVMGEIARLGGVGAIAMQKAPADRNLVGVVLVHTSETTAAGTWAAVVQGSSVLRIEQCYEAIRDAPVVVKRGHGLLRYFMRLLGWRPL